MKSMVAFDRAATPSANRSTSPRVQRRPASSLGFDNSPRLASSTIRALSPPVTNSARRKFDPQHTERLYLLAKSAAAKRERDALEEHVSQIPEIGERSRGLAHDRFPALQAPLESFPVRGRSSYTNYGALLYAESQKLREIREKERTAIQQYIARQQEDDLLENLTFRPSINPASLQLLASSPAPGKSVFDRLYSPSAATVRAPASPVVRQPSPRRTLSKPKSRVSPARPIGFRSPAISAKAASPVLTPVAEVVLEVTPIMAEPVEVPVVRAPTPPPPAPSVCDFRILGDAIEGHVLKAHGTFSNCTVDSCYFQWYRENDPIIGSTRPTYRVALADIDSTLRCDCTLPGVTEVVQARSSNVAPAEPTAKVEIVGDRLHNSRLDVRIDYYGGVAGEHIIRWARSMDGAAFVQVDCADRILQLSADDVPALVRVSVTPVRSDGVQGALVTATTDRISVEPTVAIQLKDVLQRLKEGAAVFDNLKAGGEQRILNLAKDRIKLQKKGRKTLAKASYAELGSAARNVALDGTCGMSLTLGKSAYLLSASSTAERDVIVLALRAQIAMVTEAARQRA